MFVVVGGHSRNIGKTSVVCGIVKGLKELKWTAVKVTQFGDGVCGSAGEPCDCATSPEHPFELSEEKEPSSTDSGRYLAAGARRAYWLRTAAGGLGNAVPALRKIMAENENVIFESNSILQFFKPDLYLAVMDFSVEDFKPSSLRYLDRADALIVVDKGINVPMFHGVAQGLWDQKQQFFVKPPRYVTRDILNFVGQAVATDAGKKDLSLARRK